MSKLKHRKPDWVPENNGKEFATRVVSGVKNTASQKKNIDIPKSSQMDVQDYIDGILRNDINILSKSITLVESSSEKHFSLAQEILKEVYPKSGNSIRIGISGSPGAGKSTFIDSFGSFLCNQGHKVAVLAIDPSSSRSKGSILGDKTRMEKLSQQKNSFIRPSPSAGNLGGVARKTRESILLCEASGYDVILVETIGVGQSEIAVRSMVDFYMLLLIPGAGDELQGIKKGAVELADALVVNKADGSNKDKANVTKQAYSQAVHYLLPATDGWETKVHSCSSLYDEGIQEIWDEINDFLKITKKSGLFDERRKTQSLEWFNSSIVEELKQKFFNDPKLLKLIPELEKDILSGNTTATKAVQDIINKLEITIK